MPTASRAVAATLTLAVLFSRAALAQSSILQSADRRESLNLTAPAVVTFNAVADNTDPAITVGTLVSIVPGSTPLPPGSTLSLRWDAGALPGGVATADMQPVQWNGSLWQPIRTMTRGVDSAVVTVTTGGLYAMRWVGPESRCTAPAYDALDFRLGKWNYTATGYDPGISLVVKNPNHCALEDRYEDVKGGKSASFIVYSPADTHWYITTYDPGGRTVMQGTASKDAVIFYHSPTDRDAYRRQADGTVLFSAERSADAGKSWVPWATGLYRRWHEE